jgi:hypothetical protein
MPQEFVTDTLPKVINDVLGAYPEHPYQVVFSMHEFRQKLVDQILSQTLACQVDETAAATPLCKSTNSPRSPLAERLYLEVVVRGSILQVLRENADLFGENYTLGKSGDYLLKPMFG